MTFWLFIYLIFKKDKEVIMLPNNKMLGVYYSLFLLRF